LQELEQEALIGKMLAALWLAEIYDRDLGVEKNTVTMAGFARLDGGLAHLPVSSESSGATLQRN